MFTEKKQEKTPSQREFIEDLKNTQREIMAYRQIINGLTLLAELPELDFEIPQYEIEFYEEKLKECREFFTALQTEYAETYGLLRKGGRA